MSAPTVPGATASTPDTTDEGWTAAQVTALATRVAVLGVIVALTTSLLVPILPDLDTSASNVTGC